MGEWKPIDALFDYEKGSLQSSKCTAGKYSFITAGEEWKTHEKFTHDGEALIFAMAASGSLGRTHYVNGKFISSDLCFILTPKKGLRLDLTFYYRLFNFLRADIVKKTATGTSKLAINQTNFGAYKLPYFNYDHQVIFRKKIETIAGINEELSNGMNHQLSLLAQLRQAVLQEAIEGKLTAEWRKQNLELISGENHASKLLEKIKAEKERLTKNTKITKKAKALLPISEEEKPFDLPEGWVWCKLGEINNIKSGKRIHASDYKKEGIPFLRSGEIGSLGRGESLREELFISEKKYLEIKEKFGVPSPGDILIACIGGSIGNTWVVDERKFHYKDGNLVLIEQNSLTSISYLLVYLKTPLFWNKTILNATDSSYNALTIEKLNAGLIPLPPLAEQQAIVERVDKLMAMIDELEKQVSERKEQAEMLMQSVLREAFAGEETNYG